MEWLATIFGALLVALLVGAVFSVGGVRGPGESLLAFFTILFLGTLAFGVWAQPVGPRAFGFPWLSFLIVAILLGLLVAASVPSNRERRQRVKDLPLERDDDLEPKTEPAPIDPRQSGAVGTAVAASLFFWLFLVVAIAIVAARAVTPP
jgi:cbb3-type cytochrome oxidase subunit 3